jgi:hypothetical protein
MKTISGTGQLGLAIMQLLLKKNEPDVTVNQQVYTVTSLCIVATKKL